MYDTSWTEKFLQDNLQFFDVHTPILVQVSLLLSYPTQVPAMSTEHSGSRNSGNRKTDTWPHASSPGSPTTPHSDSLTCFCSLAYYKPFHSKHFRSIQYGYHRWVEIWLGSIPAFQTDVARAGPCNPY